MSKQKQPEPKPEYAVEISIQAKDSTDRPCRICPFGFEIEAFSSDYIRVKHKGFIDCPGGAWVTLEDLDKFAVKLSQIVEKLNVLPMSNSGDVDVLWLKEGGVE